jgi:tetratricopeptide (TPR) repeat protein
MRALEAAGNTTHPIEIKKWNIENQEITVVNKNDKVYFTLRQNGVDTSIPACDVIGIPKNIDLSMLKAFLADTGVRLGRLGEHEYKLYIQPRLHGAGNIIREPSKLWPGGVVPYEIDIEKYPIGGKYRKLILDAIAQWNDSGTGFTFVPRTTQKDVLVFGEVTDACYSHVGYQGGAQYIRCHLHGEKFDQGSIMHEIGHAIGFYHEQQRYDRDQYVQLTQKGRAADYEKMPQENAFGPYDFNSIMHYPINTRLGDGQQINTHQSFSPDAAKKVGSGKTLSSGDKAAAQYLYQLSSQPSLFTRLSTTVARATSYLSSSVSTAELSRQPEWKKFVTKGDFYFEQGKYDHAFHCYKALVEEYNQFLSPSFLADLNNRCGVCCAELGYGNFAKNWYLAALKIEPQNQGIRRNYQRLMN